MQKSTRKRVFVSANSTEFSHLRRVVTEELLRKSCDPVAMDHFSTLTGKLEDLLSEKISKCDAVICLVGNVFGAKASTPPGKPPRSYTQLEFDLAQEQGKQPFIFIYKGNEFGDGPHDQLQKIFKESFRGGNLIWHSFSTEEELRRQILGIDFSSLPPPRAHALTKNIKPLLSLLGLLLLVGGGFVVADKVGKYLNGRSPDQGAHHNIPAPSPEEPRPDEPVLSGGKEKEAGKTVSIQLSPKLTKLFAWCPPGDFVMGLSPSERGSDNEGWENTKPKQVAVPQGFWIACSELTNGEAKLIIEAEKFAFANSSIDLSKDPEMPLAGVSWIDASSFVRLLSRSRSDGMEVSLPSEIQWEYAARAGTETAFSFGSECDGTQANCDGMFPFSARDRKVAPGKKIGSEIKVNSYLPNAWKIFDMHGNVKEWCLDEGVTLRTASSGDHIIRGGSWASYPKSCRSGARASAPSSIGEQGAGIRLVVQSIAPRP